MATVGNLCTTIIGDLARGDTSLSDIVLIDIKSAVREYENHRFYFNEQDINLTLSQTQTYLLSLFAAAGTGVSDIIEVDVFEVTVSGRTYTLREKPWAELKQLDSGTSTLQGYPEYFSYWAQAVKVYPMPNGTYTGTMSAHVKFTELSAMSDTNAWTNDASELIRCATLKRLWGRRFRDYTAAQAMQLAENDALASLQRRTDALTGSTLQGYL